MAAPMPKVVATFSHQLAFINRMSTDTYRGAGILETLSIWERAIELIAAEAGFDPAEVRRRRCGPRNPLRHRQVQYGIGRFGNDRIAVGGAALRIAFERSKTR